MDLNVRDVARLLRISEDQVFRLARDGTLPAIRVHDQYLFNRVEILEWAASRTHRIALEVYSGAHAAERPGGLSAALERGGVHYQVAGQTREQVLEAVTRLPGIPARVNRQLLLQLLLSREALASTGIGEGIALPHPRDPLVFPTDGVVILLCFPERPIEFASIDHQPVHTLFLLLSPSVKLHLVTLAELAHALHDSALKAMLSTRADAATILGRVRELGAKMAAPDPAAAK